MSIKIVNNDDHILITGPFPDGFLSELEELVRSCHGNKPKLRPDAIVALYNEYATKNKWQKVRLVSEKLKKDLAKAIKELPELSQWSLVMKGLEMDPFFSGATSDYKTNIQTIIFKSRYMDFYNAALDAQDSGKGTKSVDGIVDEFRSLLAGI